MELRIETNIPEVTKAFDDLRYRQVPFATSVALNRVGKAAKEEQIEGIFDRFTVRRAAFIRRSVRQKASSKRDLKTTLTVRDGFLAQHEDGGTRVPGDVGPAIVQPIASTQRRIGVIRGRNTPRGVLKSSRKAFVATMKSGKVGVFRRRGKKRLPIDLIFSFEKRVKLSKRLRFEDTTNSVVAKLWEREFGRELSRAIRTAR